MTCPEHSLLAAFLDETISSSEASHIARHIDQCPACQASLDELIPSDPATLPAPSNEEDASLTAADQTAVADLIHRLQSIEEQPKDRTDEDDERTDHQADSPFWFDLPYRLDRYTLTELVGEGATGRLYRAIDEQLGRQVAVKILRPELAAIPSARSRFEREARACAALKHDHIVAIHHVEAQRLDQPPYLVMELVDGCSVQERFSDANADQVRTGVEWIRQAAIALQAAHDAGIVHRDIKPSNLLIDESTGRLRVADFGLARLAEAEESLTADDAIAGTPAYMSPEQITNPKDVTGLSDVYSLGVVLYEILTGERPFRGTVRMVLQQVQHEEPVPPRRLNDRVARDLETICLKAMAKEQRSRYESAQALADDLDLWLTGRTVQARPVGPTGRVWRWCRRNPRLAGVVVIVAAVLAGGAIDWGRYRRLAVEDQLRREWEAEIAKRDALLDDAATRERAAEHRWQLALNVIKEALAGTSSTAQQPGLDGSLRTLTDDILAGLENRSSRDAVPAALQLAELWVVQGDHEAGRQHHESAVSHYDQARSILASPQLAVHEVQVQVELAMVTSKLAAALNRTESTRALALCEEARRLNEDLASNGERPALLRLANSYGELGSCQLRLGDFEAGMISVSRQREIFDRLTESDTGDAAVLRSAGRSWLHLAKLNASTEDWETTATSAASAVVQLRRLCEQPRSTDEDHLELAEADLLHATSTLAAGNETLKLERLRAIEARVRDIQNRKNRHDPDLSAKADSLLARCQELIEAASIAE
ncbi:MAG: serine/threonine-protein kinase [Planctomycetota bacterium]|jgi:tRNA A-37 threonylcarbamoyl transferase component Bud32